MYGHVRATKSVTLLTMRDHVRPRISAANSALTLRSRAQRGVSTCPPKPAGRRRKGEGGQCGAACGRGPWFETRPCGPLLTMRDHVRPRAGDEVGHAPHHERSCTAANKCRQLRPHPEEPRAARRLDLSAEARRAKAEGRGRPMWCRLRPWPMVRDAALRAAPHHEGSCTAVNKCRQLRPHPEEPRAARRLDLSAEARRAKAEGRGRPMWCRLR